MIHTSLSPNTQRDDLWLALKTLFMPWIWKNGLTTGMLETQFKTSLGISYAISFQRGRDGLYLLLKALGIHEGDEVILQAFTCLVVPNAIRYLGAKPVYCDIENRGFNIDPQGLENVITKKTKVLIIQHTFGEPADIATIQAICTKKNIFLIEDCAHSLSAKYLGKPVGSFGDAAIWSFGRDKIISSVWGGMVTTNDGVLADKLRAVQSELSFPSCLQIFQALLHPLVFALAKPFYRWALGKLFISFFQKLRLIPRVIFSEEKIGKKPAFIPQKMPNALAILALHQLNKLSSFHEHRISLARQYVEALKNTPGVELPGVREGSVPAWLRFTIRSKKSAEIFESAKKKGIYLGDWYRTVIAPPCDVSLFQYQPGSCPNAEKAASEVINLPTHIQISEAMVDEICSVFKTL